jgi:hypothetical protein
MTDDMNEEDFEDMANRIYREVEEEHRKQEETPVDDWLVNRPGIYRTSKGKRVFVVTQVNSKFWDKEEREKGRRRFTRTVYAYHPMLGNQYIVFNAFNGKLNERGRHKELIGDIVEFIEPWSDE